MLSLSDDLLIQITQRLTATLHPLEIHLFGSHATGKSHPHSDIDLLIVMPDLSPDSFELARRAYPALAGLLLPAELHFIRQTDFDAQTAVQFTLPYEATHTGRLIYASSPQHHATVA